MMYRRSLLVLSLIVLLGVSAVSARHPHRRNFRSRSLARSGMAMDPKDVLGNFNAVISFEKWAKTKHLSEEQQNLLALTAEASELLADNKLNDKQRRTKLTSAFPVFSELHVTNLYDLNQKVFVELQPLLVEFVKDPEIVKTLSAGPAIAGRLKITIKNEDENQSLIGRAKPNAEKGLDALEKYKKLEDDDYFVARKGCKLYFRQEREEDWKVIDLTEFSADLEENILVLTSGSLAITFTAPEVEVKGAYENPHVVDWKYDFLTHKNCFESHAVELVTVHHHVVVEDEDVHTTS